MTDLDRATRLLLLRHAETAAPDRFHGSESDIGLSERGRDQSRAVALVLREYRPSAIYSSGLLRARLTAEPIALACCSPWKIVPALHERKMGSLSGRLKDQAGWSAYNATKDRWIAGDLDYSPESVAESYAELRDRVAPVFFELARRHLGETIAVVAHGILIKTFLTGAIESLSYADFDRIPIEFTGIHDLIWDGANWLLNG